MKPDSESTRFQFRIIDLFALLLIVSVLASAIKFSGRHLPSISEPPPPLGEIREGQNWIGQGGGAYVFYSFALLVVVHCVKWTIFARCNRRLAALELFALMAALSLPYIWFLCEPDWSNSFIYRESCWFGGPITIWTIPAISFLVDLGSCGRPKSLKRFLIRSAVEIGAAFPLWAIFWAFFSFFVHDTEATSQRIIGNMEQMVQLVRNQAKQAILFNVPNANEAMFPPYVVRELREKRDYHNARLKEFCGTQGIPLVDICSRLKDEHFGDELHPNAEGAKIIAEEVFKVLSAVHKAVQEESK
jgi:hypothetical protein